MPSEAPASIDATPAPERTLSVRWSAPEYERLTDLAWRRRTTVSALARDAVRGAFPEIVGDHEAAA